MYNYFQRLLFLLLLFLSLNSFGQHNDIIESKKFVFEPQNEHVHSSTLVELPSGDLLCAWFQGSGERTADDARIMASKYLSRDKEWQEPYILAETPGVPDCNPVLFLSQGKLFLVWIAVQANRWEYSLLKVRITTDFMDTQIRWDWQDNILLKPDESFADEVQKQFSIMPKTNHGWAEYAPKYDHLILSASKDAMKRSTGWMTRIKPLIQEDGEILLPLYSDGLNFSLLARSLDNGKTWKPSRPIVGRGNIQPVLLRRKNGDLVAYMRDSGDAPSRVQMSVSKDEGYSWSYAVKTDIPSGASVEALKWSDEKWIMILNDTEDNKRNKLSLYASENEGKDWQLIHHIENDESEKGRFSYPALIKTRDGKIHLTFSHHRDNNKKAIRHVVINTDNIK